ncbi:MAG: O-acetyl-ADP-ribose deacetylase [Pirellulales bacterium]
MKTTINGCALELLQGDVAMQQVDVIVNAANADLAGGGGVDGAIHRRGGPKIMQETDLRYPAGCPTGAAVMSGAGRLPARYVAHAVGPVWQGGQRGEAQLLAGAYRASLELALEHGCQSVAFPAISTGVYGYPLDSAARVALVTIVRFLEKHGEPPLVRIVLFDAEALRIFSAELSIIAGDTI